MAQINLSTEQKQTCGCQGGGEGVGWTGSLGLVSGNYYIKNGWAMGFYCTAQGTIFSLLG